MATETSNLQINNSIVNTKLKENSTCNLYENKIIEPKFQLKFTFDLDENDYNLIHDFADPDQKIKSSEYEEKECEKHKKS